jgi:hypothetical protein
MATYTLTLRDGSTIQVEAPENATREQLAQAATQQRTAQLGAAPRRQTSRERLAELRERELAAIPEPETGFFGDLAGGFASGVVGVGETAALGAATLLDEEQELAARERIQGAANALRPSFGDEEDLTFKIASAFGSIAGFLGAGAAVTAGAGAAGLGAAGAGIAGLLGAGTLGVAAGAGEASERAREFGATEEERTAATRRGALIGATEALPVGRILGGTADVVSPVVNRLVGEIGERATAVVGERIANAAATGGAEAAQEAAANILQNLNARGYNAEQAILEGAGEAGAIGGVAGGALQLLVDTFVGRRAPSAPPPPEPLALPAPSMQVTPEGQALTEEQRLEREAVLGDMPRGAVIGGRATERQPTPEPLALPAPQLEVTPEGQAITPEQRTARLEQERLDEAELNRMLAEEEPIVGDMPPREIREGQARLRAEEARAVEPTQEVEPTTAPEDADIVDQLAAIEAAEGAQQQQAAAVRAESDLETIAGQQETQRQQATEQGRRRILQDVIENTPSRNYNRVSRVYEDALAKAGYQGDRAKPTEAELQTIQRAINVQRAERPEAPESPVAEPITAPPEATQLQEMEARIPERAAQREPEQLGLPGVRRRTQQAPVREGMPPEEPGAQPETVTDAMLDEMGIAPSSPVRQRLRGKDLNDPTTRQILTSFANQPRASQTAQLGISRRLEGVPEEQPDLFAPRRARGAVSQPAAEQIPARPAAQPAPAAQPGATQQLELFPETTPGTADVDTTPEQPRIGAGVRGGGRGVAGSGGTRGRGADTAPPPAPEPRGLGERVARAVPAETPAVRERPALEGAAQRRVLPVLETGKRRTEALAPKPQPKVTTRTGETKASVEAKLLDAYDANTSADHKRFVKALKVEAPADPMTIEDKSKVLGLLNTKSSKELKPTVGAIKKYLGAYEDPIQGLQDAVDDVVSQTPNFRSEPDMTAPEKAFFGPDNKNYLPARGKNAAQAVLDWAASNLSAATKRWMATAIRDAKANNAGIEAFQSTDLVAKRRELENVFKGGFDATNDADNKRLADVLEKLGIDENDPMVRGLLTRGSMFNLSVPPSRAPLSNVVSGLLRAGDLGAALRTLAATSNDPEVTAVASKLAKMVGDTKVEVVKSLPGGAFGRFGSGANTIEILDGPGLNTHVLLHEMTHAATVATLANKGHPLTRKLQKIFDETREHMPTAYGYTNLQEFVAEAFTNPRFQTQLAGLRVNGEPITPFAKIKAAISNFLRSLIGKPVKPVESALEQTTSLIDNILAPAPNNIGAGEFFMLAPRAAGKRVADMLSDVQKQAKPVTKEFAQKFADQTKQFLKGTAPDKAKRALLGFYPSQAVADVAERSGITGAMDLHKLMEEQRGAVNKSDQEVEGVLKSVSNWERANRDQVDALNRVVYKSTTEQVDPTKPISAYNKYRATFTTADSSSVKVEEYSTAAERDAAVATHIQNEGKGTAKKAGDADPEKVKAWRDMRADWRALSATGGDKIYAQMRDTYKKQYERMRDVIYGKIDETITDEAARKKLKNEVYARLFETGTIEPYFPLTRSGNYWLSYVADGEFTVEAFETMPERDRAMADLKADKSVKDIEKFVNVNNANYSKAPPSSFVGQTLQTLRANKVPDNVQAEIMRLFVEALPETSFAKSLQRRKGTAGYNEDAINALRTKAFDLGRQVERLRYSAKIRELQDKIAEDNRPRLTEENKYILDELDARAEFARNPPKDAIAQSANRAAFVFTIGFNASSAVVNLSQLPMFVYPMFGGRYGYGASWRAIMDASKLVTSSGFDRKSSMVAPYGNEPNIKVRAMPSIDNYFELDANGDYVIRKDSDLEPEVRAKVEELKPLVEMMAARGQLNRSLFADNLGVDSSGRERGVIDTVTAASAFMFHNVEVFNRQVTAVSAYQLELARLKKAEPNLSAAEMQTKAAERALYDTQMTNGGSVLETAPRFSQQGWGRVALMYKTYGIQMYYSMFKTVRDGIEAHYAGDKDKRNEAMRQFAGVMGASFMLAGVVGMPLARELMQLVNFFFLDEEEDTAETAVRKAIGEGFYKGPLTALLGVDLSSRIGLSGLILQANRFNHDASLEEDVFHYLGGPAWSIISSYNRGFKDIMNGEVERGVEAMLPAGVRNAYQAAFRFPNDDGILTRRGDPIMDDLSFGELAAKFVGFAPAEYTRTQEMNQQTKNVDRAVNTSRTSLLRRYYVATRMGDYDERRRMMQRIQEFNRRHPTARIDADSLRRSMRQHMETSATMYNGITISPNMRRALEESRNEWNQGFQLFD